MKKLKLVGMLAAVVMLMLMFIVVASYLSEKNVDCLLYTSDAADE